MLCPDQAFEKVSLRYPGPLSMKNMKKVTTPRTCKTTLESYLNISFGSARRSRS